MAALADPIQGGEQVVDVGGALARREGELPDGAACIHRKYQGNHEM
jgi:hypothetical protein